MNPASSPTVACRGGKRKSLPPVEYLKECFEYRPDDPIGLYWATRPRHHFVSDNGHHSWNGRFAGKAAGARAFRQDGEKKRIEIGLSLGRETGNCLYSASRIIMALFGRDIPDGYEVRCIDGDAWNISEKNLEVVHPTKNLQITALKPKKGKKSGLPVGVFHDKTSYGSRISRDGRDYFVGNFRTVEEAVEARRQKLLEFESGRIAASKKKKSVAMLSRERLKKDVKALPTREFLREALDFDPNTGLFTWRIRPAHHFTSVRGMNISNASYAGKQAGVVVDRTDFNGSPKQYAMICLSGQRFYSHRLVFAWRGITIPDGMQVDHINGIGTDNRPVNLRIVTNQRNNFNSKRRRGTLDPHLPRGIQKMLNGTYLATLRLNGMGHDCGTHESVELAVAARRKKAEELGILDWVD